MQNQKIKIMKEHRNQTIFEQNTKYIREHKHGSMNNKVLVFRMPPITIMYKIRKFLNKNYCLCVFMGKLNRRNAKTDCLNNNKIRPILS